MSDSIKRETLLKAANLVRAALSTGDYIPALKHIRFDGTYATAYNDVSAISVRMEIDVKRCVPGETLIRALQSFNAAEVLIQQKDSEVLISSGRSKLKVPTLALDDFPLKWPQDDYTEIPLDRAIVKGVERCLMNVGNDPTHPECMGVTLDTEDGKATLFSTDNFTISRYRTDAKLKLPGEAPVILPTFFCDQLVSLARHFSDEEVTLHIGAGFLIAEFGDKGRIFTRTLVDKEPLDFQGMVNGMLKIKVKDLVAIPDAFDAALQRALLVLGAETDKVTTIEMETSGFSMLSTAPTGEADDMMKCEDDPGFDSPDTVYVDPQLVARGAKVAASLGFLKKGMVLADKEGRFVHIVAYCTK